MPAEDCARVLRKFGGETPAPRPPRRTRREISADVRAGLSRELLSRRSIRSRDVVVESAPSRLRGGCPRRRRPQRHRDQREALAEQIERMTADDPRRLHAVGHSKGAAELLEMLAMRARHRVARRGAAHGRRRARRAARLPTSCTACTTSRSPSCRSRAATGGQGMRSAGLTPDGAREWWAVGPRRGHAACLLARHAAGSRRLSPVARSCRTRTVTLSRATTTACCACRTR